MKIRNTSPVLRYFFCLAFLTVPTSTLQMPARPGQLHITSTPKGAKITINGAGRSEVTDTTLIVSPGTYKVQVGNCAEKPISVASGEMKEVSRP
jgi:hypothetical protein